jgi:hypothetical protein
MNLHDHPKIGVKPDPKKPWSNPNLSLEERVAAAAAAMNAIDLDKTNDEQRAEALKAGMKQKGPVSAAEGSKLGSAIELLGQMTEPGVAGGFLPEQESSGGLEKEFQDTLRKKKTEKAAKLALAKARKEAMAADPTKPVYSLSEQSTKLVLTIQIPLMKSAKEMELDISPWTLLFTDVGGMYKLDLQLPQAVIDGEASAKFDKVHKKLTITIPTAAKAPAAPVAAKKPSPAPAPAPAKKPDVPAPIKKSAPAPAPAKKPAAPAPAPAPAKKPAAPAPEPAKNPKKPAQKKLPEPHMVTRAPEFKFRQHEQAVTLLLSTPNVDPVSVFCTWGEGSDAWFGDVQQAGGSSEKAGVPCRHLMVTYVDREGRKFALGPKLLHGDVLPSGSKVDVSDSNVVVVLQKAGRSHWPGPFVHGTTPGLSAASVATAMPAFSWRQSALKAAFILEVEDAQQQDLCLEWSRGAGEPDGTARLRFGAGVGAEAVTYDLRVRVAQGSCAQDERSCVDCADKNVLLVLHKTTAAEWGEEVLANAIQLWAEEEEEEQEGGEQEEEEQEEEEQEEEEQEEKKQEKEQQQKTEQEPQEQEQQAVEEEQQAVEEEEDEETRWQRVDDSLAMHFDERSRQKEEEKARLLANEEAQAKFLAEQQEATEQAMAPPPSPGRSRFAAATRIDSPRERAAGQTTTGQTTKSAPEARPMEWTAATDRELVELVRSCTFDFEKVAQRMHFAILQTDEVGTVVLDASVCRMRFTQLQKAKEQQRSMPPPKQEVRAVEWTAALDALLVEEADRTIYDFEEVANTIRSHVGAGHAIDATICRLRLATLEG